MLTGPRAFLGHILDYAGLFPPANLGLEESLRNYRLYQQSPDNWLLGRFICPAARLGELTALPGERLSLSVLGRGGKDPQEFFDGVRADLADIRNLGSQFVAEAYEVRLPPAMFSAPRVNQLSALVGTVAYLIETSGLPRLTPFFECPVLEPSAVQALIQALMADGQSREAQQRKACAPAGWKLRCGGLDKNAFPSPKEVALVLAACCAAGIPWKATAGLHHPFRHFDAGLQTPMHGFVNVFGAGILAHAGQIDETQIEAMLADDELSHFRLDDSGFAWRDFRAAPAQIMAAREHFVTSFGSCSFDEPCADLRRLGWM